MLALPGHTSEQRTLSKTQNNHLTAKAPYKFAHGKPLGPLGLQWLCVRLANAYGKDGVDKAEHYEQARWVEDNRELIHRTADNPLEFTWWTDDTEDPWCLL